MEVDTDRKRKHVEFKDEPEIVDELDNFLKAAQEDGEEMIGQGAGNHAPFIPQKYNQVLDPSQLDDDTLYRLLNEAKAREERKSLFEMRRQEHKVQRPSNASMFLDSVQSFTNHPAQLFNANSLYVRNNSSNQTYTSSSSKPSSGLVWL
jgi:hypothetical protein